jgi:vacuolar protein sorting-associated protein 18
MKTRAYSTVSQHQRCEYCTDLLFGKPFYLFPCSHGFHCHCLLQRASQFLSPAQVSAVQGVEELLRGLAGRGKDFSLDRRGRAEQEALQQELDGYIAADCPFCGFAMIQALSQPLIGQQAADIEEAKSWAI